jgi:hypothetical protein
MVRDDSSVTWEEVIGRLDEFSGQHAIYAEAPKPGARALVTSDDAETDLAYLLEVAAVIHYAVYDAWLPME